MWNVAERGGGGGFIRRKAWATGPILNLTYVAQTVLCTLHSFSVGSSAIMEFQSTTELVFQPTVQRENRIAAVE